MPKVQISNYDKIAGHKITKVVSAENIVEKVKEVNVGLVASKLPLCGVKTTALNEELVR